MVTIEYLQKFLQEDAPFGDITSQSVVPDMECRAVITVEEPAIIAGVAEAGALFRSCGVTATERVSDGTAVKKGDVVLSLHGNARTILTIERTALNILGRMSGIATMTRRFTETVSTVRPSCRIAATRKTCPGFRELDKKAVMIGGGDPHRWSLSDGILIKDNHLRLVSIPDAVARAKACSSYHIVEVEVSSAEDALVAAGAGADVIMLDNMSPDQVQETIAVLAGRGLRERVLIEISGGIDAESLTGYAEKGADIISIGALTHSVRNIALHLDITG